MSPSVRLSIRQLGRGLIGPAIIPAALLLLLGTAGWLAARMRAAERSHRVTAERALRDYAAFAAWQLARREAESLGCFARRSTYRAYSHVLHAGEPLPSAAVLDPDSTGEGCGFGHDTRVAFRVTVPGGGVSTSGPDSAAARLVVRLAPALVATWRPAVGVVPRPAPPGRDPRAEQRARFWFDTVGTAAGPVRVGVASAPMRDEAGAVRAVYGVVGTLGPRLAHDFAELMDGGPLLPPSLVRDAPNDRLVRVEVTFADGARAYAGGVPSSSRYAADDSVGASLGSLVVHVALAPAVAASLSVGRLPNSGLPLALAVLGLAVALAGVALGQLRRSRELDRLRTRFVADVSHELRTPLAHIALFSETLALGRERSPAEGRHFAATIHRETRRLTMLVESVLRFSRPDGAAGVRRPLPRRERCDVAADVRDAVYAFAPLAAAEAVRVDAALADEAYALADAGSVRQIVFNLLDNAVKYGPRGQCVRVYVAHAAGEVWLSVEDEGPGVPPADRVRVFEPFTRLERADASHVSGAGIGLAVVRDLMTALGGRAWLEDARAAAPRGARAVCAFRAAPSAPVGAAGRVSAPGLSHGAERAMQPAPR